MLTIFKHGFMQSSAALERILEVFQFCFEVLTVSVICIVPNTNHQNNGNYVCTCIGRLLQE